MQDKAVVQDVHDGEPPAEGFERLIEAEIEALEALKALLASPVKPKPSAVALQVATCNRRRLRTIAHLEAYAGCCLQRVTPALRPSAVEAASPVPVKAPSAGDHQKKV